MFEIQKDIAIPTQPTRRAPKYPFDDMEIGDSFYVPCESDEPMARVKSRMLGACAWAKRRLPSRRFIVRAQGEGVRIWRVE